MIDDKYLDEEEKDLIEALDDIDIAALPKPTVDRQRMFKDAAREFRLTTQKGDSASPHSVEPRQQLPRT